MELNKIYFDSDFSNTVVPSGQRFLFLGYDNGVEGGQVVIRYKDSDGNFGNIASGSSVSDASSQYIEVSSVIENKIETPSCSIPIFIRTANGNFYPVEKDTISYSNNNFYIDVESYLAYDNVSEFSGVWRVYFAGGTKGDSLKYDEAGVFEDRSKYDRESYKFSYLATDEGAIYVKMSDDNGDWSTPIYVGLSGDLETRISRLEQLLQQASEELDTI